ncbi:MAG: YfhO family protein [Planctomycetes bacterium]|nr:YfhO family protein [Planctomycetota bacterium]
MGASTTREPSPRGAPLVVSAAGPLAPWIVGAAVALVFLVIFRAPAFGGSLPRDVVDTDDVAFVGTVFEQAAAKVRSGHFPLWFHEFDGGSPLAASWMYGLLSPGLALFLVLPFGAAWAWTAAVHAGLGAAGMASFLGRRNCSLQAAVTGAVLFAVSEWFVGRTACGHLNLVLPVAWMPWVLRWIDACVKGERRAVPALAICAAAGLLAGHVQVWFYLGPLAAAFALVESMGARDRGAAFRRIAGGAALAVAIAAAQIALTAEFLSQALPAVETPQVVLGVSVPPGTLALKAIAAFPGPAPAAADLDFRHEFRGIAGVWAFALAAFGFVRGAPRRWLWGGAAVAGLVASMGTRTPFTAWIQDVPPFSSARSPGRFLLLPLTAVPVLAAHGVDAVGARFAATHWLCRAVRFLVVPAAIAFGVPGVASVPDSLFRQDVAALLPPAARGHRVHARALYQMTNLERAVPGGDPQWTLRMPCFVRTKGWGPLVDAPSPAVAWWVDLACEVEPGGGPDAFTLTSLLAKPYPTMGPAGFFGAAVTGVTDDAALRRLQAGERTLFLDGPAVPADAGARGTARLVAAPPGRLEFDVESSGPGWLVVSTRLYPGWTYSVDGEPAETRRGNLAFPVVRVATAGRHRVTAEYAPASWRIGASVSLLALGLTLFLLVRAGRVGSAG